MKIAAINLLPNGSPATIMRGILEVAEKNIQAETLSFYGNWKGSAPEYKGSVRFGYRIENYISAIIAKYTGIHGKGSVLGTMSLIRRLKKYNPDIIHLHNLHLWCVNIPLLFRYIKRSDIKVVWTLHDCWAFTGRCPYFLMENCQKWKTGCFDCSYPSNEYPSTKIDNTKIMWNLKKRWFQGVKNMTLVTPSNWLEGLLRQSFLSRYPIVVINNGIDLSVFRPLKSDFRMKYRIDTTKTILLGVSLSWTKYKGIDVFVELFDKLDNKAFQIVLVGVDEKLKKQLPEGIICIAKTNSPEELAEIYTAADIFVNPTREENFPTVNMESIACGTPVISFDTGGSLETLSKNTGEVVDYDDVHSLVKAIQEISCTKKYYGFNWQKEAKRYDMNEAYKRYVNLYEEIFNE